jgi:hypothetical protein
MMKGTHEICAAALGALALFGSFNCSGDFDPYNRLTSLRVMAIRSEPAVPLGDETATLSALVFAPAPGDPQTEDPSLLYRWEWCPFPGPSNDGYPCLVTDDQLRAVTGDPTLSLSLGDQPTASLRNLITSPEVKAMLCDGMGGIASVDCTGGFPLQIKLFVSTDTDSVGVTTIFRARWGLGPQDVNANPTLSALSAKVSGVDLLIDPANSAGVSLVRDRENDLSLDPSLVDQSETYQGLDDSGQMATLQERLFVSWFVETGDTKEASTGYIPGMSAASVLLENTWTPALEKKYPASTARIFLVLRDNRAGVSFTEGSVNLVDPPEAAP